MTTDRTDIDLLLEDLDEEIEAEGFVCLYLIGWTAKSLFPEMRFDQIRDLTEMAFRSLRDDRRMKVVEMPWPAFIEKAVEIDEPTSIDFSYRTSEELELPLLALAV